MFYFFKKNLTKPLDTKLSVQKYNIVNEKIIQINN